MTVEKQIVDFETEQAIIRDRIHTAKLHGMYIDDFLEHEKRQAELARTRTFDREDRRRR